MQEHQNQQANTPNNTSGDSPQKPTKNNKSIHPKKNKPLHKNRPSFTSTSYRRQKCQFFNKGHCSKGNLCTYSHDFTPDTHKKICKFYLSGSCSKSTQCQYSHETSMYPCKFYHIMKQCTHLNDCRFSHMKIEEGFYDQYMRDNKEFILKMYMEKRLPVGDVQRLKEYIKEDLEKEVVVVPKIGVRVGVQKKKVMEDPRKRIMRRHVVQIEEIEKQIKMQQSRQETIRKGITRWLFSFY